jgi:hypothetical protein
MFGTQVCVGGVCGCYGGIDEGEEGEPCEDGRGDGGYD